MKPRVLILVDTYAIGGPGKGILQFLKYGGVELSKPMLAGFWRGPASKWQFRDAVENIGAHFQVLKQIHAFDPTCIYRAWRLIRNNNIQVLESHGYKAHIVCLALSRLTGIPWISYVHGWTSENFKIYLYNYSEKLVVRFADRIVPVSEELKNRLQLGSRVLRKTTVITNAADLIDTTVYFPDKRVELNVKNDDILVSVIGRLSPEKGLDYFIAAMHLLSKIHPQLKAVLVGEGQERKSLENLICRLGLADTVFLVGYQEDVSPYYYASDIVCMPSLSEGMPNVALEAMMFGKPVAATNVGGIPEVVINEETGLLVESRNPAALARALEKLLMDASNRKEMGRKGKQRVEKYFNPKLRVERICQIYNDVLNGNGRGPF